MRNSIDQKTARRLILHGQGILKPDQLGRGINAVQKAIEQLSYVQIDTISVVNRAHHHVLKNRVSNYQEQDLHRLLSDRKTIFEYWSHAAAYIPTQDYRYYMNTMQGYRKHRPVDKKIQKEIINRILTEGPCQSRDFENTDTKKSTGWWDWKPAKQVMENMFLSGELMVKERRGFQKVYDLTENILPDHIDTSKPTPLETGTYYVQRMLGALGIATSSDIGYARPTIRRFAKINIIPSIEQALQTLKETGDVMEYTINNRPHYALTRSIENLPSRIGQKRAVILSPFDNLVINRNRLQEQFGFNYLLECYVPQAKRVYGYFTLPILLGDKFIGRLDAKAHRKQRILDLNNAWFEQTPNDESLSALSDALLAFADSLNCNKIRFINLKSNKHFKQLYEKMRLAQSLGQVPQHEIISGK